MRRAVFVVFLLSGGCAVHEPAYRLAGGTLVPPGVRDASVHLRKFMAVGISAGLGTCPSGPGIALRKRGRRIEVTASSELLAQPAGAVAAWAAHAEAAHCVEQGAAWDLADQVARALPADLNRAFQLLYANHIRSGWVDLGLYARLQVTGPVSPDFAPGFETAWYSAEPRENRPGIRFSPQFAERRTASGVERLPAPTRDYLHFAAEASFYRIFYKAGQTEYTALVVAGRTFAELERRTQELESGGACAEMCVGIPKNVGVNPWLAVRVNGAEVLVAWGASVADAIKAAGGTAASQPLRVRKLFQGKPVDVKFEPGNTAILQMVLTGGEEITFVK